MLSYLGKQAPSDTIPYPPKGAGECFPAARKRYYHVNSICFKTRKAPGGRFVATSASTLGFSLVEISAAIAILSFSFVSLLGLLSSGMTQFHAALDSTVTAQ